LRTGILIVVVVLLALAAGLAATNPTRQEYGVFLEGQLSLALAKMDQGKSQDGQIIRQILRTQGEKLIHSIVWSNTVRQNYGLFSIFETRALNARMAFLGVGRTFFPLDDMDEVARNLGRVIMTPEKSG
jgi:hypothetical protein